jgi:hypothetical protein
VIIPDEGKNASHKGIYPQKNGVSLQILQILKNKINGEEK